MNLLSRRRQYVLPFIALISLTIMIGSTNAKVSFEPTTAFHHNLQVRSHKLLGIRNLQRSNVINKNPLTKRNHPFDTHKQTKLHLSPTITSSLATILPSTTTVIRGGALASITASSLKLSRVMPLLHENTFYVLSSILVLSSFGIILEKRTTIGKALSVSILY